MSHDYLVLHIIDSSLSPEMPLPPLDSMSVFTYIKTTPDERM